MSFTTIKKEKLLMEVKKMEDEIKKEDNPIQANPTNPRNPKRELDAADANVPEDKEPEQLVKEIEKLERQVEGGDSNYVFANNFTVQEELAVHGKSTFNDSVIYNKNAGAVSYVGTDHVYMQFYPDGIGAGRKGYFGFPSVSSIDLTFGNEYNGGDFDIKLVGSGHFRTGGGTGTNVASLSSTNADYVRAIIENKDADGDAQTSYMGAGTTKWSVGYDDSSGDYIISRGFGAFGTNDYLKVDTAGNVDIPTGHLGIGAPANAGKGIYAYDGTLDYDEDWAGLQIYYLKTAGATTTTDDFRGAYNFIGINDADQEHGYIRGMLNIARLTAGDIGNSTVTRDIRGHYMIVDLDGGKIWGTSYGQYVRTDQEAGNEMTGSAYGQYITMDMDGTVGGNSYMLYLDEDSNIDYGIYQNNAGKNVLGGDLEVPELNVTGINSDGTGKVVCIKADKSLGTCTDQPDVSGVCTCT